MVSGGGGEGSAAGGGGAPALARPLPSAVGAAVPPHDAGAATSIRVTRPLVGHSLTLRPFAPEDVPGLFDAGSGAAFMGAPPYDADSVVWR